MTSEDTLWPCSLSQTPLSALPPADTGKLCQRGHADVEFAGSNLANAILGSNQKGNYRILCPVTAEGRKELVSIHKLGKYIIHVGHDTFLCKLLTTTPLDDQIRWQLTQNAIYR